MKTLSLEEIERILNAYEDEAEHYAREGNLMDMHGWTMHATAARRIRKLLFEAAGAVDLRAEQYAKEEADLIRTMRSLAGKTTLSRKDLDAATKTVERVAAPRKQKR